MSEHCIRTPGGTTICKNGKDGSISGTHISVGAASLGTSVKIKNGQISKACVNYTLGPYSGSKCVSTKKK